MPIRRAGRCAHGNRKGRMSAGAGGSDAPRHTSSDDTRMEQLAALTVRLQEEPLWRASLGSLELFHSNMLEYLATSFPSEAEAVLALERDGSQGRVSVKRERRHLDLIVDLPGCRPVVIENKLFDFPDARQLTGYSQKIPALRLRDPSLVLLSLMD